jgi:3-phenylpropionate/cinnamic acid dioxygenase small subunit
VTSAVSREVRLDVTDVLVAYATGIDRRDWDLFRRCFTDDCEADYGDIGVWHGADEITEWMRRTHEPCGPTLHRITNAAVAADGGSVTARCYVDALILLPDGVTGARAAGFYDDVLVATGGGWRIARRRFTPVLYQAVDERPAAGA